MNFDNARWRPARGAEVHVLDPDVPRDAARIDALLNRLQEMRDRIADCDVVIADRSAGWQLRRSAAERTKYDALVEIDWIRAHVPARLFEEVAS